MLRKKMTQCFLKRYTRAAEVRSSSSYFHKVGNKPFLHHTVGEVVEIAANKWPNRTAIIDKYQGKSVTFSEFSEQVDKLAVGFYELGLQDGDRLGIWAPNSIEWILTLFAAARVGLVSVAINPVYQKPEIEFCLKKVDVKALVVPEEYKSAQYYKMLTEIIPELPTSEAGKLKSNNLEKLKSIVTIGENDLPGVINFNKLISSADTNYYASTVKRKASKIQPESGCNIQFTSGTTGNPKAALLSHKSLVNNSYFIGMRNNFDQEPVKICVQVPLFHVFGVVASIMTAFTHGVTLVLPNPSYSPRRSMEALLEEKCDVVYGTPTMHVDLLASIQAKGASVKTKLVVTGGASCPPEMLKNMKKIMGAESVKSLYGLTETTSASFQSLHGEDITKTTDTVGQLHDHLEAKVIDEQGLLVPFGTPGELCLRGYSTLLEYWGDPEKTNETIGKDGWLRTGDQFILYEDGYGKVIGRLKDVIIRGGENVYPKEIEDVIDTHPDILETQVFGVSDDRLGEEICVAVRLRNNMATMNEKVIQEYCKGKLAKFKIPKYVKVMEQFPKTTSGKIQKNKLKAIYESGNI